MAVIERRACVCVVICTQMSSVTVAKETHTYKYRSLEHGDVNAVLM